MGTKPCWQSADTPFVEHKHFLKDLVSHLCQTTHRLWVLLYSVMKTKCEIVTEKDCNREPKSSQRSLYYPWELPSQPCQPRERCLMREERVCRTEHEKICQPYRRPHRFRRRRHFKVCSEQDKWKQNTGTVISTIWMWHRLSAFTKDTIRKTRWSVICTLQAPAQSPLSTASKMQECP